MHKTWQNSGTGPRFEASGGTLHSVVGPHTPMGILHMEKERQLHNQDNWCLQPLITSRSNMGRGEPIPRLPQNEVGIP